MTGVGFNVRGLSDAAAQAVRKVADRTPLKPWRVSVFRPPTRGAVNTVRFYDPQVTVVISGDGWRSIARHPSAHVAKDYALAAIGRAAPAVLAMPSTARRPVTDTEFAGSDRYDHPLGIARRTHWPSSPAPLP